MSAENCRPQAPGCVRDLRQHTDVSAELEFFNDAAAARAFIEAGVMPIADRLPSRCRVVDLGGGDGFLLQQVATQLRDRGHEVSPIVVDANVRSLLRAQGRGVEVLPASLEEVKLAPADLLLMRLVNHYNGYARQLRILSRASSNLVPGGVLVCQIETGNFAHCAYRNILARWLETGGAPVPAESCRWLTAETFARVLERRELRIHHRDLHFMTFEMRLETLLLLAWQRVHGLPAGSQATFSFDSWRLRADDLARRYLATGRLEGLTLPADGHLKLRTRHALIVAEKSAR